MQIAILGAGYVGLVSAACFADFGHRVTCIDKDPRKIALLKAGEIPIFEPGLQDMVRSNVAAGRLSFEDQLGAGLETAEVVFIAVGTPSRRGDGFADLSYVYAAAAEMAPHLAAAKAVVVKSTVPIGTGDEVSRILRETTPTLQLAVVSNPEFLREGAAITDFKHPDRIVIGLEDDAAREVMTAVYKPLYLNHSPILFTRRRAAELIKYAANAFLAMKITYINEIADLCEQVDADVKDVARGIGLDNRIGAKFLHPGPGYGGSCFPKDTLALVKTAQDFGSPLRLIETTIAINDQRKRVIAHKVVAALGGEIRGKRIAILGLTFKPNTDDMRDAPSLHIIQALQDGGAQIQAYDPEGMEAARALMSGVTFCPSVEVAATGADALVIVTEWEVFRALDFTRLKAVMARPVIVDLRNVYSAEDVAPFGFTHVGVGRPASTRKQAALAAE